MSQRLSGPGRPVVSRFTWLEEHRLVVAWLHERFSLSPKERAAVFNTVFDKYLQQCGKPEGQNGNSLSSQYNESNKPAAQHNSWRDVYKPPRTSAHSQRRLELESQVIDTIFSVTRKQPVPKKPVSKPKESATRPGTPSVSTPPEIAQIRAAAYASPSSIPAKRPVSLIQDLDNGHNSPVSRPANRPRLAPQHRSPRSLASAPVTITTQGVVRSKSAHSETEERQLLGVFLPSTGVGGGSGSASPHNHLVTTPRPSSARKPTSGRSRSRPRDLLPKHTVQRAYGPSLEMTADELERFNGPATPVTVKAAFPPTPSLLFRYWDETSQGTNSEQGFVAGRFYRNNMPIKPAPHPKDLDLSDLYTHYSRDAIATPFISTSCFLMWIVRLAVKEMHAGKKNGKISVIDPAQLPPRSFYFSRPCHQATLYKMPYTKGQHMYGGACEFLVWHRIPQAAVLHTFSVTDLVQHTERNAPFSGIVQLSTLTLPRTMYATRIRRLMKAANKTLTPKNIGAVCEMVDFTGLDCRSSAAHISHVIGDTLRGLGFVIERQTEAEWQQKSSIFAHAMAKTSDYPLTLQENENLRLAFLNGVVWSCGGWTWSDRIKEIRLMPLRASKIGLASPAQILANELDAAKTHLTMLEKRQQGMFASHRAQELLQDGVSDDGEQESLAIDVESVAVQEQPDELADMDGDDFTDEEEAEFESEDEQILYE